MKINIYLHNSDGSVGRIAFPDVSEGNNPILDVLGTPESPLGAAFYLVSDVGSTVSVLWDRIARITSGDPEIDPLEERELWSSSASAAESP